MPKCDLLPKCDLKRYGEPSIGLVTSQPVLLPRAQLRLTPTPALVVSVQGGITLGPEQGELGAEK